LFLEFFKIGLFTFGGGYAMIPLVEETVMQHAWLSQAEFYNFIGVCESTPGPIAVNMATFVGAELGGVLGAACATLGVVLPSFVVILIVARCFRAFCESKWVKGVMSGLKPAVVGLIASAAVTIGTAVFVTHSDTFPWFWAIVTVTMLALTIKFKKLHPIVIICICAALGIAAGYLGL
jgi:chromate transporter